MRPNSSLQFPLCGHLPRRVPSEHIRLSRGVDPANRVLAAATAGWSVSGAIASTMRRIEKARSSMPRSACCPYSALIPPASPRKSRRPSAAAITPSSNLRMIYHAAREAPGAERGSYLPTPACPHGKFPPDLRTNASFKLVSILSLVSRNPRRNSGSVSDQKADGRREPH